MVGVLHHVAYYVPSALRTVLSQNLASIIVCVCFHNVRLYVKLHVRFCIYPFTGNFLILDLWQNNNSI